jgi:hypothetical protein
VSNDVVLYRNSSNQLIRIAGTETTAGFLAGLFNQLLRDSRVLKKLQDEIRSAFKSDAEINFEDLVKLPYLTAVIEEGLRIFPSAPIGFVRTVPQGGDTIDGEFVPEGVSPLFYPPSDYSLADSGNSDNRLGTHVGCNSQREKFQGPLQVLPRALAGQGKQHRQVRCIQPILTWV